jgi:16S rRNA (uracil1498-N3)-methyltransferase
MPQFFISSADISQNRCRIGGDDFRHLAMVRRAKPGDSIRLRNEKGASLTARIERVTGEFVEAVIIGESAALPGSAEITLCICLLKGKNFDTAIEKAVEVGVARVIPVVSERTVPRPSDEDARVRRWNRKAEEAAKQSLREAVPVVERVFNFRELISSRRDPALIIAHPGAAVPMKEYLHGRRPGAVSLLVGPEGGFSPAELGAAASEGWTAVNLGLSHLRAGTAAAVLCGIIVYEWGDAVTPLPPECEE